MDRTSNGPFEPVRSQPSGLSTGVDLWVQVEFDRLTKSAEHDKVKLPTKKELNKKSEEMTKLSTAIITEVHVLRVAVPISAG